MSTAVLQPMGASPTHATSSYIPLRTAAANVVNRVKQSSSMAKYGVEKLEAVANSALSYVPPPVVSRVTKYGSPVLEAVDNNLEYAYNRVGAMRSSVRDNVTNQVDAARTVILNNQWFTHVDALFTTVTGKSLTRAQWNAQDLSPLVTSFYVNASNQFLMLIRSGHESEAEFVKALKTRMQHVWNESLNEPTAEFYHCAVALYNNSLQKSAENGEEHINGSEWTTKTLLQRVQPLLGNEWEQQVVSAFQFSVKSPAQLLYVASLQQYIRLSEKTAETGRQGKVKSTEFIASMRDRLGQAWMDSLEQPLKELLSAWSVAASTAAQNTRARRDSARDLVIGKWQYLLLAAQNVFDTVLPSLESDSNVVDEMMTEMNGGSSVKKSKSHEEEKEGVVDQQDEVIHVTLNSLASHVNERVRERGIVDNIKTASNNVVHTAVHTAMALPYVEPVIKSVKSVKDQASAAASTTKPFVQDHMKHVYEVVHFQVESAYGRVKTNLDHIQHSLHGLAEQTKSTVKHVIHGDVVVSIQHALPQTIQHALSELQNKLQLAVHHAKQLQHDGTEYVLEHRVTKLSRDLLTAVSTQIANVQRKGVAQLSSEQIAALLQVVETAKHNVGQLVLWTSRQSALENGEELDFEMNTQESAEIVQPIEESKEQEMMD